MFNNRDITPMDTLQLAKSEAESWKLAQLVPVLEEASMDNEQSEMEMPSR